MQSVLSAVRLAVELVQQPHGRFREVDVDYLDEVQVAGVHRPLSKGDELSESGDGHEIEFPRLVDYYEDAGKFLYDRLYETVNSQCTEGPEPAIEV